MRSYTQYKGGNRNIGRRYIKRSYFEVLAKQTTLAIMLIMVFAVTPYMNNGVGELIRDKYNRYLSQWDMAVGIKNMGVEDIQDAIVMRIDKGVSWLTQKESVFVTVREEFVYPTEGIVKGADKALVIRNVSDGSVKSSYSGSVQKVEIEDGKFSLTVSHGKSIETKYEGLIKVYCKEGDSVDVGEVLGFAQYIKDEGFTTTFRLYYMGEEKDVLRYMDGNGESEEV